ncbi:MAG TPA: DMT family transporter [Polyangia bacterium]|jgi:drug/metabolite transporter (DMT)-like permease
MGSFSLGIGEIYSVACAAIWAFATILFRKGGERVPPVALNVFKDVIALVLFLVTLPLLGVPLLGGGHATRDWVILLVSGAMGIGIADTIFFASLNRLGAVGSSIINSLYSPMVVAAAALYLREPLRTALIAGAVLMVGAILIGTWAPGAAQPRPDRRRALEGIGLGVLSMALMAVGIVLAKPVLTRTDPWWAATVRVIGGVALLALQALASSSARREVLACFRPQRVWRLTMPAAVIGGYVGMVIWVMGFKYASASTAGVLNQTNGIFVLLFAALLLGERITTRKVVAIAMAFAGAVVVVL